LRGSVNGTRVTGTLRGRLVVTFRNLGLPSQTKIYKIFSRRWIGMGYTGEKKRQYAREWFANRRKEYFKDKKCVICGSTKDLQLDHINPETKEHHNIWSWSEERRNEELKKCQVLCKKCHRDKSNQENKIRMTGIPNMACRKLNENQVIEIKKLKEEGYTVRKLAEIFKISHPNIVRLLNGEHYKNMGR
jgi:5-methylcytosine-specific restriction endonuclease McrA